MIYFKPFLMKSQKLMKRNTIFIVNISQLVFLVEAIIPFLTCYNIHLLSIERKGVAIWQGAVSNISNYFNRDIGQNRYSFLYDGLPDTVTSV